jgi:hypothetical protein
MAIPPSLIGLTILGYDGLVDPRIGPNGVAVNNSGTFILPDPQKKFYWEQFWLPLWTVAADRLRDANEVFIHGYSMPTADSHARQLLFDNINKSAAINVHCRSASDLIAEDFRSRGFNEIERHFAEDLPYRTGVLLAHYKMTRESWTVKRGTVKWLHACFVASLVVGRTYLSMLVIGKSGNALAPFDVKPHDVTFEDGWNAC